MAELGFAHLSERDGESMICMRFRDAFPLTEAKPASAHSAVRRKFGSYHLIVEHLVGHLIVTEHVYGKMLVFTVLDAVFYEDAMANCYGFS